MDLAERYFLLAERIWPRDSQMLSEFANFYIGQARYDKAIEYLERSRKMTPFVPRTHELLAYAYMQARRPQDALATAQHAATMPYHHPALAYAVIAGAHEQLGQHDKAVEAWREVVKDPNGNMWLNFAMMARAQAYTGQKAAALTTADTALAKGRNNQRVVQTANRLKQAIGSGCYDTVPAGECDALRGWQIGVTSPVSNVR
jgi:tetratricopeptide (TPR) repeat protein